MSGPDFEFHNQLDIFCSKGHTRSNSAPVPKSPNLIPVPVLTSPLRKESVGLDIRDEFFDIFELLSTKTKRPKQSCDFNGVHNGLAAIRLATWNLEGLTQQKIGNSGVLEVITRTIVENGYVITRLFLLFACRTMEQSDRVSPLIELMKHI